MADSQSHSRKIADKKAEYNEGRLYCKSPTLKIRVEFFNEGFIGTLWRSRGPVGHSRLNYLAFQRTCKRFIDNSIKKSNI